LEFHVSKENRELYDLYSQHADAFHAYVNNNLEAAKALFPKPKANTTLLPMSEEEIEKNRLAVEKRTYIHGPFLCSPQEFYWNADIKIVFVGQETNGWGPKFKSVEQQMKIYFDFEVGTKKTKSNKGPFWTTIRRIEKEVNGYKKCCASLNLNKFDINNKTPNGDFMQKMLQFDHLIQSEIDLLKPDVVIFFTGHRFDGRLMNIFHTGITEVEGFVSDALCEIVVPNKPYRMFRTYHPGYFVRNKYKDKNVKGLLEKLISLTKG
jgi:hypothetical protein